MSGIWGPALIDTERSKTSVFNINTSQAAATYDLLTASGGDVQIESVTFYTSVAGVGLVSVSVQTNDTTPVEMLSAAEGALAALTVGKNLKQFTTRTILASTKKIQYTIVGTGSGGTIKAIIKWIPCVAGAILS